MYYLGIDLGGTNIAVGVVDKNYNIVGRGKVKTGASRPYEEIVEDMAKAAFAAVKDAGLTIDDIACAGIAAPGTVDPVSGYVIYANNLPFAKTPVAPALEKLLGRKCYIDNDANAAAYGELLAGAGRNTSNFIAITLGTGVGGGIVIDGKIYSGFNFAGAELGHIIICVGGEQCTCGNKGCFEAYASASALISQTKKAMEEDKQSKMWEVAKTLGDVSGRTAFDAMRLGDEKAAQVVDTYIGYIAYGLISLINAFQPEFICIGGGICNEGDTLLVPLKEKIGKGDYNKYLDKKTEIIRAQLGNDAGIIGAAMLWK